MKDDWALRINKKIPADVVFAMLKAAGLSCVHSEQQAKDFYNNGPYIYLCSSVSFPGQYSFTTAGRSNEFNTIDCFLLWFCETPEQIEAKGIRAEIDKLQRRLKELGEGV